MALPIWQINITTKTDIPKTRGKSQIVYLFKIIYTISSHVKKNPNYLRDENQQDMRVIYSTDIKTLVKDIVKDIWVKNHT